MSEIILLFVSVPVVTGLIGWGTNWAAVRMIFNPPRFVGIGPIGWQGIVYKQSHKFATGVADMATTNLLTASQLMGQLDPDEIEALLSDTLDDEAEAICKAAAEVVQPGVWDGLPDHVRAMILAQVKTRTRAIARELFETLTERADEFLDLNALVYSQLSGANADRLAEFTKHIGRKEFKFVEYYGGVFGFVIGLAQVTVWSVMQIWWLMPLVGILVGLVTNWLAIQMIFRPQQPKKYFGLFTYQGLFAKRQPEIAADYGQVAGEELLTPRNLMSFMMRGEGGGKLIAMVTETISTRLDEEWQKFQPIVPVQVTPAQIAQVKATVLARFT
ncbi:MAG: DUF445 family protein, partial [Myxococcota bacterium]